MPFLKFTHQSPVILINIKHIVGMIPTIGLHDTQNGMETTVKIVTSRPELDQTFLFSSEDEATEFMLGIAEYVAKPKTPTFELHAEAVETED